MALSTFSGLPLNLSVASNDPRTTLRIHSTATYCSPFSQNNSQNRDKGGKLQHRLSLIRQNVLPRECAEERRRRVPVCPPWQTAVQRSCLHVEQSPSALAFLFPDERAKSCSLKHQIYFWGILYTFRRLKKHLFWKSKTCLIQTVL